MKKLICSVFLLAMLSFISSPSQAALVSSGNPFEIGSWSQEFNEAGVGNYDRMLISLTSGAGFETPGFDGFTVAGWTSNFYSTSLVEALGPSTTNMNFNIRFLGDQSAPLSFNFYAFLGNSLLESASATWNGNGPWDITLGASTPPPAVPIPAAAWLLGSGIVGLVALRRRQK